jgi:hypothetical protein
MSNNIELLSQYDNFTIGTNSNLSQILANLVKVGTDTSNVTISIPQDISSSYNLILPVRQGASGESLVYGADGQLKWHDTTVLKQVVSVYGSGLKGNLITTTGTHDSPTYLDAYTANITPMADNSKIFVQFKINYHAALSTSNQISFFIKKTYDGNETIFTESLFGPYNGAGGFTGQYISNLVDEALTSSSISYQLGYQINGNVYATDVLGILGYDNSHNNTIVLQEFEGSGVYATSVWNKGSDSNGLYYNDGTVHIGSSKDALGSQNTPGVALELSGNLVGTYAIFSGNVYASAMHVDDLFVGPNTIYIDGQRVLNKNEDTGSINIYTDKIVSDASNGLTIQAKGNNGNIILDPSGTGSIQLNGDVELSGGNINAETFIGDLSGNVSGVDVTILQGDVTTLQTSVESKQAIITSTTDLSIKDLTLSGSLRGPSTMYIDPANDGETGTLIVNGNLQVKGTTTTIDSETLLIADNSIILNKDYSEDSPSENASIEIERGNLSNAIIQWNETNDQWEFYREGTGNLSNIKCNTLKVNTTDTLGNISATTSGTTLTINGDSNISYGVYSLSDSIITINTITVSNVENNSQILIYYTNNSTGDLTINNTITGCKTNLSEPLTVSTGSSVLFCLVNINSTYILTVSQLYL